MANEKGATSKIGPQIFKATLVFKATLGTGGEVVKRAQVTEAQAVAERRVGQDVVVCGNDLPANREMAKNIELTASGRYKRCPPHANAGPDALPHYQPHSRPPAGHTFYETANRKAK